MKEKEKKHKVKIEDNKVKYIREFILSQMMHFNGPSIKKFFVENKPQLFSQWRAKNNNTWAYFLQIKW